MDAKEHSRISNLPFMFSLPVEILLHIFHIIAEDDMYAVDGSVDSVRLPEEPDSPSSLWNITHVCHMFRHLAISTPTLWTSLFIDLRLGLHDSDGDAHHLCPGGAACLRERIARSGTSALKLHIRVGCHALKRDREDGDMSNFSQPIITTLLANAERFTVIRMWTNSWANIAGVSHLYRFGEFQALKVLEWGTLSTVGRLSDRRSYRPIHFDALSFAKELRHLELPSLTPELFRVICWTDLVHVSIGHVPVPEVSRLFTLLNTMGKLRTLSVMLEPLAPEKGTLLLKQGTIRLPNLKDITVTGSYPLTAALLERLDVPEIESMTLSFSYRTHLSPIHTDHFPSLKKLSISFRKCSGDASACITSISRAMPSLEQLSVFATSNAQHCIEAVFETLLDETICPHLNYLSIDGHAGNAATILHTIRKRVGLRLDYTCHELVADGEDISQLNQLAAAGHLELPCLHHQSPLPDITRRCFPRNVSAGPHILDGAVIPDRISH